MSSIVFHNQLIINKGETPSYVYKLTRGTASILDAHNTPILILKANNYLNLAQVVYQCCSTKTVKANGRCEVVKIRAKDAHKQVFRKLKEGGLRKSNFHAFQDIPAGYFYSLMLHSSTQIIEKNQSLVASKDHLYLIVEGTAFISKEDKVKLLKLDSGELLVSYDANTSIHSENVQVKVACVGMALVQTLLGQHYRKIKLLGDHQREVIDSYEARNQRLSVDHKKSQQQGQAQSSIPKYFANKIQAKVERFNQYRRARSCFSSCKLSPRQVIRQNQKKYFELLDLNRKKYGEDYVYKKRLEISREVHSLSQGKTRHSPSQKDLNVSIYQLYSLKSHFGILKRHPQFHKFQQKERNLVRRTAILKKTFTSTRATRANSRLS